VAKPTAMNDQNLDPNKSGTTDKNQTETNNPTKTGLDAWNDRLDENLEPEAEGDVEADENAEDFQESADEDAKPA
jgi:hypothetical protein